MIDIRMPRELVGNIQSDQEIARGPFVAMHNGEFGVGAYMAHNGDYVTFWDGSRTQSIDNSYVIDGNGTDRVTARSSQYDSSFLFRPLALSDAEQLFPDPKERPTRLNELIEIVRDQLLINVVS